MTSPLKLCASCRVEKEIDEFYRRPDTKSGRQATCKPCFEERRRFRDPLFLFKAAFRTRQADAKKLGLSFTITIEELLPLPTHCPALGIPLRHSVGLSKGGADSSPSIDRIIPALGYVPGNVIVVSMKANRIKNDATPEELMAVAQFYATL